MTNENTPRRSVKLAVEPSFAQTPLAKDRVRVRCGDCAHFNGTPNPAVADVPCSKNGTLATKMAPPCYSADVISLRTLGPQAMQALNAILTTARPKQLRILMGLMANASSLERAGLSFMEEVFFYVGSTPDSLENLYRGYALASLPDKQVSVIGGSILNPRNGAVVAVIYKDRLLTQKKFERHVKALTREGKVHAPITRKANALSLSEELDIPHMDMSIEEMEKRAKKGLKQKPKKETVAKTDAPVSTSNRAAPKKGTLFNIGG